MNSTHILQANAVEKSVQVGQENLKILKPLSFSVEKGEALAIVGESGSGKSTLLGILAGLDKPSAGTITLANHQLSNLSEDECAAVRGAHVGFVFQSFHLLPHLTALENVMLPLELLNKPNAQEKSKAILDRVGLSHRLKHYPKLLSGGEQQRVALARAFVTEPDILFADEPTGNLDSKTGRGVASLMYELNQEKKTTLILVTHDEKLSNDCGRRLTLSAGEVVSDVKL